MRWIAILAIYVSVDAGTTAAQGPPAPWRGEHLQHFPKDIPRPELMIAMLEMNGEFYPKSADIDFTLGELHRGRGENDRAIQRYRATVVGLIAAVLASSANAQDAVPARMQAWSKALGVECVHCHVEDKWTDASKPTFAFAARMSNMLHAVNAGPLKDVGPISCWTCHRGRSIPARLRREAWEKIRSDHAGEFADTPNRAIAMSVYAASLGVDCSHCHENDRALNTKAPKALVPKMNAIFAEIPRHFEDTRRPVTQCFMCHQGTVKPER